MPFYEYECTSCKFYTEVMQKISDAPMTKCPSCGKKALKKLVSAPNFRLKGGGWYETDFKGDKENKRNLAGGDKDDSSSTSESAKPDSSKGDAAKSDASKMDASKGDSSKGDSSKSESKSDGGSAKGTESKGSGSESKSSSGGESRESRGVRRGASAGKSGSGRSAKPVARTVASKAKPALSRGKSKPAPAKKKTRR